jgi:hypothetical protein
MKRIPFLLLLLGLTFGASIAQPKPILAAEYYFDNVDPGYGNGFPITVPNPNEQLDLSFTIPTTGLNPGLHQLDVRVRRDTAWSDTHRRFFLINQASLHPEDTSLIVAGEYYFGDADPGLGSGEPLTAPQAGVETTFLDQIDLGGFAAGFYQLSLRVRNDQGSWSGTHTRFFYLPDSISPYKLTQFAYEIRQGGSVVGTGTVPISPSQYTVELNFDANTAALTPGFYDLCVTAVDEANRESTQACRVFQVAGGPMATEAELDLGLSAYPNPTRGSMTVRSETLPLLSYQLSDASGRVMEGKSLPAGSRQFQLDLGQQANGVYFLALEQAGRVTVKAVVKR